VSIKNYKLVCSFLTGTFQVSEELCIDTYIKALQMYSCNYKAAISPEVHIVFNSILDTNLVNARFSSFGTIFSKCMLWFAIPYWKL